MIIEKDRLQKIINSIKKKKIAVIGDIMLDRYIWGDVERISPEAPVPVVKVKRETERPGGAANAAWNIKELEAEPIIVGVIGKDTFGEILKEKLEGLGIKTACIIEDIRRTTTNKTRIIANNQQVTRVDRESNHDLEDNLRKKVLEKFMAIIHSVSVVVISDYGKGVVTSWLLKRIISETIRKNIFIIVDPKESHFKLYNGASLITPNEKEAGNAVSIKISDEKSLIKAGKKLKTLSNVDNILITQGSKGMSLFTNDGYIQHFPTMARQVFDVTGAGDTVVAALAAAISSGASLREAAIFSSHAAGIVVGKIGTATATNDEIVASIRMEENKKYNVDHIPKR